jgi:hypothetical protein
MNEKIKELMVNSGFATGYDRTQTGRWILSDKELEKFAELIVRECVGITDELVNRNVDGSWTSNELYTDYNGALFEVKRRIQDSFGVEE